MLTINKILPFIILSSFVTLVSCTSTKMQSSTTPPDWVINTSSAYPESEYIAAVGFSTDRNSAEAQAISNVSKIIRQKVEAQSTATQVFENNLTEQTNTLETNVKTSTILDEISGIKIQEIWINNTGTVYALATINKNETGAYYRNKIKDNEAAINALINVMLNNEATFEGIDAIEKALAIAKENAIYIDMLAVINPSMYKSLSLAYQSDTALEVVAQKEREKIVVSIFVQNDSNGRIASMLSTLFSNNGYKTSIATSSNENSYAYTLSANLSVEDLEMTSTQNNEYVRFVLDTKLINKAGKTLLAWNTNGREAHFTHNEAAQRAIRTIEERIQKEYKKELEKFL